MAATVAACATFRYIYIWNYTSENTSIFRIVKSLTRLNTHNTEELKRDTTTYYMKYIRSRIIRLSIQCERHNFPDRSKQPTERFFGISFILIAFCISHLVVDMPDSVYRKISFHLCRIHSYYLFAHLFFCVSPRMPRNIVDERDEREIERERARQEYDGSWTFATSKAVSNNDDDDGLMTITIHSLTHFKIKIIKFRQSFSSWTFPIVLLNNRSGSMAQTATVFAPYIVWNGRYRIF